MPSSFLPSSGRGGHNSPRRFAMNCTLGMHAGRITYHGTTFRVQTKNLPCGYRTSRPAHTHPSYDRASMTFHLPLLAVHDGSSRGTMLPGGYRFTRSALWSCQCSYAKAVGRSPVTVLTPRPLPSSGVLPRPFPLALLALYGSHCNGRLPFCQSASLGSFRSPLGPCRHRGSRCVLAT